MSECIHTRSIGTADNDTDKFEKLLFEKIVALSRIRPRTQTERYAGYTRIRVVSETPRPRPCVAMIDKIQVSGGFVPPLTAKNV